MAYDIVPPRPASTIEPLNALGYTLESAIPDLVKKSIDAGPGTIDLDFHRNDPASYISVADDGKGMTEADLQTAMAVAAHLPECGRAGAFRYWTQDRELLTDIAAVGVDAVGEEQDVERPDLEPRARRQFHRTATPAKPTRPGRESLRSCRRSCQVQARSCLVTKVVCSDCCKDGSRRR